MLVSLFSFLLLVTFLLFVVLFFFLLLLLLLSSHVVVVVVVSLLSSEVWVCVVSKIFFEKIAPLQCVLRGTKKRS